MKKSTCILLILILGLSIKCSISSDKETVDYVDLTGDVRQERSLNLSEIASSIEYFPLETNLTSIIGSYDKFEISSKHILIWDRILNRIQLFDSVGHHLGQISRMGKGPEEWMRLQCMNLDEKNGNIIILTQDKNIKVYNPEGQFLQNTQLDNWALGIFPIENEYLLIYPYPYKFLADNYSFRMIDHSGLIKGEYLQQYNSFITPQDPIMFFHAYKYHDTISYWEKYCDTVYGFNHGKVSARWFLKLPEPPTGKQKYERIINQDYNIGLNVYGFTECKDQIFIKSNLDKKMHFMYYDKVNKTAFKLSPNNSLRYYGLNNDLDGGYPFWPAYYKDGFMYEIVEYEVLYKSLIETEYLSKSECLNPANKNKLLELLLSLDPDSNPILIKVALK